MIGVLLTLFVLAALMPRALRALVSVAALVLLTFGVWVLLHPECQSDACRQALFNYQNNVR